MLQHSKKTIAVPPGETIREQLEYRGMSQKEFAVRMGMSEKHISHLINGKVELTVEAAIRLEAVLGLPAEFWNRLEASYRESLLRVKEENEMEQDLELAAHFPYAEMARLGWVPVAQKCEEQVVNLRSFFEVARLQALEKLRVPGIAYMAGDSGVENDYMLAAWAQKARMEARNIEVSDICVEQISSCISDLKKLVSEAEAEVEQELRELFAECGISLVFLPVMEKTRPYGAAFMDGKRIVLALTGMKENKENFWYSLFHELGHIVKGHIYGVQSVSAEQEQQADIFAREMLTQYL